MHSSLLYFGCCNWTKCPSSAQGSCHCMVWEVHGLRRAWVIRGTQPYPVSQDDSFCSSGTFPCEVFVTPPSPNPPNPTFKLFIDHQSYILRAQRSVKQEHLPLRKSQVSPCTTTVASSHHTCSQARHSPNWGPLSSMLPSRTIVHCKVFRLSQQASSVSGH